MKYEVIESVNHDLKDYRPGDSLELEEVIAQSLLDLGKIRKPFGQRESTLPPSDPVSPLTPTSEADLLQTLPQRGEREAKLKLLFQTEGWKEIQRIAQVHGIVKPPAGWDAAIPMILDKEFPQDNQPDLTQPPS